VGLQGSINALADLKREEDAYIDVSLAQRKKALVQLGRLSARKDGISSELHTLEEDEGEPLGQELRDLGSKYESITQEIRALEEKLVGMRNRRRWLKDKMEDVRNKREAGLSGYRGALKDVESELTTILKRPPVKPLDPEMYGKVDDSEGLPANSSGGEFLQLLPERRTIDMAKSWWEGEISLLERRKEQIAKERQALEEGSVVWGDVIRQVTNFESNLRQLMKTITSPQEPKEDSPPTEDLLREHTAAMDTVVTELERHMEEAEKKHWNLLICAIGAELEAFKEARNMLKGVFATADEASQEETCARESNEPQGIDQQEKSFANIVDDQPDESDNEVPPDLLVSHYEEHGCNPPSSSRSESDLHEDDSGNEIPPEFLDGEDRSSKGQ
jgi:chromosome segregation ATPase